MIGTTLAHYEIIGSLGKGGMGEVWRARDTQLEREVAIKTLPSEFANDPERLGRFEREAKLLAALNHAHIGTIYGLDEDQGVRFLAMELIEGQTIDERLKDGPLPVDEALRLALQIAEALEAAHDKGVVHRDLKPANIMVTNEGSVKVLDFGLAKAFSGDPNQASPAHSPALSLAATQQGIILGTAGYMSPEQASGQATDQRADVWAFGVVLFEMLSGLPLFTGESVPHILAGILRSEPEWDRLPKNLDPRVRTLLERCLEKQTRNRYHGIADARVDIEKILDDPEDAATHAVAQAGSTKRSKLPWLAACAAALALAAVAGVAAWTMKPSDPRPVIRAEHRLPEGRGFRALPRSMLTISPDGSQLIYNSNDGLYLRSLDSLVDRLIPGTEAVLTNPVFSPDGQSVAFARAGGGSGLVQLQKIAVVGGAAVTLTEMPSMPYGISWEEDDTIIYSLPTAVMRVSANGGQAEELFGTGNIVWSVDLLPDGNTLLISDLAGLTLILPLDADAPTALFQGEGARYVATGHIVYVQGGVLFAVPFDLDTLQVSGGPVPMIEGVRSGPPQFDVSDSGTLVWVPGAVSVDDSRVLALVDRDGAIEQLNLPPAPYRSPRVSPDGLKIAIEIQGADGQSNVWIHDLTGQVQMRQLTRGGNNTRPIWTPDGERVTFASDRDGSGIWWQNADFSGVAERLTTADIEQRPGSWNPSGQVLAFTTVLPGGGGQALGVSTYSRDTGQTEVFYDLPTGNQESPAFSPDGKWLAYSSFEPGATSSQVFLQPFPATGEVHPITTTGEAHPLWSSDGSELFFRRSVAAAAEPAMSSVAITTEPAVTWGAQRTLLSNNFYVQTQERSFDTLPDGERFLIMRQAGLTESSDAPQQPQVNIVVNWIEELKQRVPTQ